ncbi:MAG: LPS export ABC transporter permease LptG [Cellvibrionales bacterium TMED49]|nr:LPS export ABC transporter permease LptG [Porticoccaceae bacterium]OUU39591.1 MAG: LPS export ABC transporter permease LptG [Cellvibrionales bacterium TMED49]
MKILSGHIANSVFSAIVIALVVVVGIDAISAIVDELDSIRNNYKLKDVFIYVATSLPSRVYEYLPISTLIGCLFGLGQLADRSEIVIMRGAGISTTEIVFSVIRPALFFVFLGLILGEYFAPYLDQLAKGQREYLRKGDLEVDSTSGLWIREGNEFMHFNAVFPGGVLFGVTRFQFDKNLKLIQASYSSRASYNSINNVWVEENVSLTRFYPGQLETDKLITRDWNSDLSPELLVVNILPPDRLSISTLYYYVNFLKDQDVSTDVYELALWRKITQPFVIISLVLLGISFVFGPLRGSSIGSKIFVGVLIGVVFNIFQDLLGSTSVVIGFSPWLAVLAPILLCTLCGVLLLTKTK